MRPSWPSAATPSSRPISSVIRPFSTFSTVVPVNRMVLPVAAGSGRRACRRTRHRCGCRRPPTDQPRVTPTDQVGGDPEVQVRERCADLLRNGGPCTRRAEQPAVVNCRTRAALRTAGCRPRSRAAATSSGWLSRVPASYTCSNRPMLSAGGPRSSSSASGCRSIGHAPRPARRGKPSAAPAAAPPARGRRPPARAGHTRSGPGDVERQARVQRFVQQFPGLVEPAMDDIERAQLTGTRRPASCSRGAPPGRAPPVRGGARHQGGPR